MNGGLKNKVALVTGAGKHDGIGFGVAESLAREGVHVILADLPAQESDASLSPGGIEEIRELADELSGKYGIKALAVALDVSSMASCLAMAAEIKIHFPVVHILCNNAGVSLGTGKAVHMYDEKTWVDALDVNLTGMFRVSKAIIPMMTEGGSIINMSSRSGKVPPLYNGAYAVSKAGVIMLSKVQAKELASENIRVNAICPGQILTGMESWRFEFKANALGSTIEEQEQEQIKTIPLGRLGTVEEVGKVAVFLASDAASYITGQAINITGGQLMEI